jgi:hypothetical protein
MSTETQDVLGRIFAALSGGGSGSGGGGLAGIVAPGGGGLAGTIASAITGGGGSNANASATPTQSGGSTAASIGMDVLKSGLGLVPLVGGLLGLFGGGSEAPPALVKYALPPRMDFAGAESGSGIEQADYDQSGTARSYSQGADTASRSGGQPSINVTVQAMDARSFLDRSGDIAAAVRDAMLNLNSINDVVNDL